MLSDDLVRIVELDEQNNGDRLQTPVPLLIFGFAGHGNAQLGEELGHDDRDAIVNVVLVNLDLNN
jgi:hypothetical protein